MTYHHCVPSLSPDVTGNDGEVMFLKEQNIFTAPHAVLEFDLIFAERVDPVEPSRRVFVEE